MLPTDQLGQILELLLRVSVPDELVDAEVGVRAVGEADGAGCPGDLLHGDAVVHVPEPHPAVLLGRGEAVEVEVPHEPPQVHVPREVVGGVDGRGARRDGLLRELAHALLELLLRVVEEEGGRGEEPRRAAAGRRAAEERREPPLHRRSGRAWSERAAQHVSKAKRTKPPAGLSMREAT